MGTNLLRLTPISLWDFSLLKCQVTVIIRLLAFLSVGCQPKLFTKMCYHLSFQLSFRCNRLLCSCEFCTFFATSGTKCFQLHLNYRSGSDDVVYASCDLCPTNSFSKSYDFSKLSLPTQPTTSTSILNFTTVQALWQKTLKPT